MCAARFVISHLKSRTRYSGVLVGNQRPTEMRSTDSVPFIPHHLSEADCHGLSPLLFTHINPYGTFLLDMHPLANRSPSQAPASKAGNSISTTGGVKRVCSLHTDNTPLCYMKHG